MTKPNPEDPGRTSERRSLRVEQDSIGERLDVFLARALGASRSQVRRWLGAGAVSTAGRPLGLGDKGSPVAAGDSYDVEPLPGPAAAAARPEPSAPLPVLAEGPGWAVIDKAPGIPVHPLEPHETGTLLNALIARHPELHGVGEGGLRSGVVHRLDVDTSGALVMAWEAGSWERLRGAFRSHRVEKRYRALVEGRLVLGEGREQLDQRVGLRVAQHRPARVRVVDASLVGTDPEVRLGEQTLQVLERFAEATLLEVRPRTGFLHQIRATLAELGHPVLGDQAYGADPERLPAPRQMLHAASVGFEEVRGESPDPADFRGVLERLRG